MRFFYAFLILFFFSLESIGQSLEWNRLLEENDTTKYTVIRRAHVKSNGNINVAGIFSVGVDFNPDPGNTQTISPKSGSQTNIFFGEYDDQGGLNWIKHISGDSWMTLSGQNVASNGNVILTGIFDDQIDLNPDAGQALYTPLFGGVEDFFISKYGADGSFTFGRHISSTIHAWSSALAVDNSGNIIVAGETRGTTDFDPGIGTQNRTSNNDYLFIAKYNAFGNYINVISMGDTTSGIHQEIHDVDIDASDNIYISGRLSGAVDFDPGAGTTVLTSNGSDDFFIAKYNSSLQLQWAYSLGGNAGEGEGITQEIIGNQLIVSGAYKNTIDLDLKSGTQNFTSNGGDDVFMVRYDLSANHQYSTSFGGSGTELVRAIDYVNDTTIYITGHFQNTVNFNTGSGTNQLTAGGNSTVFFARYTNEFEYKWASRISGNDDLWATDIKAIDGNPVVFGRIFRSGTADFNETWGITDNYSGPAMFMAKYESCGIIEITPSIVDANCGVKNGSISVILNGGQGPYSYAWTGGRADSLFSGTYFVTVTDTAHCSSTSDQIIINDSDGPIVSVQNKVNVSCNGGEDGAILITVTGGTSPFTYSWSNGKTDKNINLLKAGLYELTVKDDDDCQSTLQVEILEPDAISVGIIENEPTCGNSDGALTAIASGGASPYNYSWTPGGTGGTQTGLSAGVYRVTVTDLNNCMYTEAVALSNDNAPTVTLDNVVDALCGSGGGAINISVSGGSPSYGYGWTPGGFITQDIAGLQPGEYDLLVTDQAPCIAAFKAEVKAKKANAPDICMVDVDSASGNAQVVWEKPTNPGSIKYYNVYRETTAKNVFDLIKDSIVFSELSLYEDKYADTWVRPWSYKISTTDTCGIVSELSESHTTIHTVVAKNLQNEINIYWTHYEGNFSFSSYGCDRYTNAGGMVRIDTFPSNVHTYTDKNPGSLGPDLYYFLSVDHPTGCTPTEAKTKNSTRSNRGSISAPKFGDTVGVNEVPLQFVEFQVNPNPNNGEFILELDSEFDGYAEIQLIDIQGKSIYYEQKYVHSGANSINFDVQKVPGGIYLLQLDLNNERSFARVMINSTE